MDWTLIEEKLESLRRCVVRVRDKTPDTLEALLSEVDLQDVLVLNLTRAVQLCVDIGSHLLSESGANAPATMAETFVSLEEMGVIGADTSRAMRQAVGFRNLAVHQYEGIDWQIVWEICHKGPDDLRRFCAEVSGFLESSKG